MLGRLLRVRPLALGVCVALAGGCTTFRDWAHNGFKVGPNFEQPPAISSAAWIDAGDPRIVTRYPRQDDWWNVFADPVIPGLIEKARQDNLDLRAAGLRVLQARAQRNISVGNLFPQSQNLIGDYAHVQLGKNLNVFGNPQASLPSTLNVWATGFNASWELDFWGRFRRQIESSNADLESSAETYRDALVTLFADVATNYVQLRTFQQRIAFARNNVEIQKETLALAQARLQAGKGTELDVKQARSSLSQTESTIPPLLIGARQASDRLCILLGLPAQDLAGYLGDGSIPAVPPSVGVGIPAELINRRPDVRKALRDAASQSAKIGIAEADFYPAIGVTGFMGYAADDLARLFSEKSFTSVVLPNFQWKILNYGRIRNNVRAQNAAFQARVYQYQQTVLIAGREVEDAMVAFLQYQVQARSLEESVRDAADSVEIVQALYKGGLVDFNRVLTAQSQLVALQDQLAVARGNIVVSLIAVSRALGGGWQAFENAPVAGVEKK
jgi:NodT family efflux transporter outer membrane factor (OMF) lipoprotein